MRLSQDFHFDILDHSRIHAIGSFATEILHSRRQRAIWQSIIQRVFHESTVRIHQPLPLFIRCGASAKPYLTTCGNSSLT